MAMRLGWEYVVCRELPPIVTGFTPHWRPALYAVAIVVTDALIYHAKGFSFIVEHNFTQADDVRLLGRRSLMFRLVARSGLEQGLGLPSKKQAREFENAVKNVKQVIAAKAFYEGILIQVKK